MVDQLSPLDPVSLPGTYGNTGSGVGVTLSEVQPGSIVQLAAWPGQEGMLLNALREASGLALPETPGAGIALQDRCGFGFAPGRYLVADQQEGLYARLAAAVLASVGAVTDLTHGRTVIRIEGPWGEWVLSKLFAIEFSQRAFPVGHARATQHHDVFAQIQRTGPDQFDLYVFRSFARSFWKTLCHAAEEVGYEVR